MVISKKKYKTTGVYLGRYNRYDLDSRRLTNTILKNNL